MLTGIASLACLAFAISTFPGIRPRPGYSPHWDGGVELGAWLTIGVVCAVRGWPTRARVGWLVIAAGIEFEAVGQGVYYWYVQGLHPVPYPSIADGFYLLFYPVTYVGIALVLRPLLGRVSASVCLDGLVAGLSVGALACGTVLTPVLSIAGDGHLSEVATNLAYPIGDVALLALTCGALVVVADRGPVLWLLTLSMLGTAVGDVVYLLKEANGTYRPGGWIDVVWTAALLISALAADRRAGPSRPAIGGDTPASQRGIVLMVLPLLLSIVDVGVLDVRPRGVGGWMATTLASLAVTAALGRLGLTVRQVRALADSGRLARTDDLTGLANRRHFYTTLHSETRRGGRVAVLLLDVDRFKEVNDSLGHRLGDELLAQLARRLGAGLDPGVTLARFGGDEFAVLLRDADAGAAMAVALRLAAALVEPFDLVGMSIHVDISIGAALLPLHATDVDELLQLADIAMYRAKVNRSGFELSNLAVDDVPSRRLEDVDALRRGLERGEMVLHYQPKLDVASGTITGVEALVRWQHPTRGLLYPDTFLGLVEQSGLMRALTTEVLRLALVQARQWRCAGRDLSVAVNLSASDLLDRRLPEHVGRLLADHGLPPQALELEITETVLMSDPEGSMVVLQALRAMGVTIAVDDYGTGYSSLAYLQDLPVDTLKLDRSFVARSMSDPRSNAIVRSTVGLAHALQMRIVAEGVETTEVLREIEDAGCDLVQGYLLSRPVPPGQLDEWLDARQRRAGVVAV